MHIPLNTEVCIANTVFTGKEMVDYITDYLENIRNRKVFPSVTPGKYDYVKSFHINQEVDLDVKKT